MKPFISKNIIYSLLVLLFLGTFLFSVANVKQKNNLKGSNSNNTDIDIVKANISYYYLSRPYNNAQKFFSSQLADGSWPDINYKDQSAATWKPMDHLYRLSQICLSYENPKSNDFHNALVMAKINAGLNFWYNSKLKSTNWWWNTIGQQLSIIDILNSLQKDISPEELQKGVSLLNAPTDVESQYATGENLIWYASEQFARGILTGNERDIFTALDTIQNQISITTEEGIQPDYSFHQHGPQLYNGDYGLDFIDNVIYFAKITNTTKFAFSKQKLLLLSNCILKGTGMMIRNKTLDYSTMGRSMTRKTADAAAIRLLPLCSDLGFLIPDQKDLFNRLINHINGTGDSYSFIGDKYFWNSDFLVHQRRNYYCSLKMVSNRTVGTESGNGENVLGGWLPYGLTYIMRSGNEYKNIFPDWDWNKLPGVTCLNVANPITNKIDSSIPSFVAGVSDGVYGASTMQLNRLGLSGQKSWFFFDNEIVALGCNITSSLSASTTLNQCIAGGDICLNNDNNIVNNINHYQGKASWVLNDSIGYIFPTATNINVTNNNQSGTWKSINQQYNSDIVQKRIFTLWINHGGNVKNASYEYIVLPAIDRIFIKNYFTNMPIRIIENDANFQCVVNEELSIAEIILFRTDSYVKINSSIAVKADQPCLIILNYKSDKLVLTLSNPSYQNKIINVTIKNNGVVIKSPFTFLDCANNGITKSKVLNN